MESFSQFLTNTQLSAESRQLVQEEARHNYTIEMENTFLKAVKDALFEAFQTSLDSANDELKNKSLRVVESVLIELTFMER